jgi:CBS domain-containing protein
VNQVRIHDLMTADPTFATATTSTHEVARVMVTGRFRHLPVVGNRGVVGMVDVADVCRALLNALDG